MTDNLFDRLADLFNTSGPVNWKLAREIAESVAGPSEPVDPWAAEQLADLTATAQRLVASESPLDAMTAGGSMRAVDRRTFAADDIERLAYLAEPIAEMFSGSDLPAGAIPQLAPSLLGLQFGALRGVQSRRACGSFEADLPPSEATSLSLVPANIDDLAIEADVPVEQARLWAALREVSHHAVLATPWAREHLVMLGHAHGSEFHIDTESIVEQFAALQDPEQLQRLTEGSEEGPGLDLPVTTGPSAAALTAFVAAIDGYGAHVTARVGAAYLPDLPAIEAAVATRREAASESEAPLLAALGLESLISRGHGFCTEVARRWGDEALDRMWEGPDSLPSASELEDPTGWAARVLLD